MVEQLGGEVARDCRAYAWQRGYAGAGSMSLAAIRGYVKARTGEYVGFKVEEIVARRCVNPALQARIETAALEQLAALVLRDYLSDAPPVGERSLAA